MIMMTKPKWAIMGVHTHIHRGCTGNESSSTIRWSLAELSLQFTAGKLFDTEPLTYHLVEGQAS
jgi:hypothetical protein